VRQARTTSRWFLELDGGFRGGQGLDDPRCAEQEFQVSPGRALRTEALSELGPVSPALASRRGWPGQTSTLALARGLRVRRERKHLTQASLARRIGSSQSRVAKMETGDPSVSIDLLVRTLLALGADPREVARIIGSAAA